MTAQDRFDEVLRAVHDTCLRDLGFRKKGATFRRAREDALPLLDDGPPSWAARGWPMEYECHFRDRLPALRSGTDDWWTLRSLLPSWRVRADVVAALVEHGLPWLDLHLETLQTARHEQARRRSAGSRARVRGWAVLRAHMTTSAAHPALRRDRSGRGGAPCGPTWALMKS